MPAGLYTLALKANYPGGLDAAQLVVTGADGEDHVLDIPAASGWQAVTLADIPLPEGTVRVAVRATGAGGQSLTVDGLSLRRQTIDTSALEALVGEADALQAEDYASAGWAEFADARDDAAAVLTALSTQAQVDAAAARLTAARDALLSALQSVTSAPSSLLVAVGAEFDPAAVTLTGSFADGTTRALTASEYSVVGFDTAAPAKLTVSLRADASLTATGADAVEATLSVEVLRPWAIGQAYPSGAAVLYEGTRWVASWYTKGQRPGDVNGPWQQQIEGADGTAVWTASRIFNAGDVVSHAGHTYKAKWWTRAQAPGTPYGPWELIG